MNKKYIFGLLVIAVLVIFGGFFMRSDKSVLNGTIRIGAAIPVSGNESGFGENIRNGAELAIKEINENGGVLGKKLELTVEDNKSIATSSDEAVRKLVADGSEFMITGTSEQTEEAIPVIDENKIITMTVAASSPGLTKKSEYLFRTWPSDSIAINSLMSYAKDMGYKKVVVVQSENKWGDELSAEIKNYGKKFGVEIAGTVTIEEDAKNFGPQIQKLKQLKPDLLFIPIKAGTIEGFITAAREQGLVLPMYYPNDLTIIGFTGKVQVEYLKNIIFVVTHPPTQQFIDAYKKQYSNAMPGLAADTAYDAVYALAGAIEKARSTESDKIKNSFEKFDGASGTISFNENRDRSLSTIGFMTWNGTSPAPEAVK